MGGQKERRVEKEKRKRKEKEKRKRMEKEKRKRMEKENKGRGQRKMDLENQRDRLQLYLQHVQPTNAQTLIMSTCSMHTRRMTTCSDSSRGWSGSMTCSGGRQTVP